MVYLFFGICIIAATFCLGFRSLNKNFWGLVSKYIASLSFLIIGITAFAKNPACNMNYFVPLFLGLILCHAGDAFLGVKELTPTYRKRLIPIGLFAFLLGHVAFSTAFNLTSGFYFVTAIVAAVAAILTFGGSYVFKFEIPLWMRILITLYSFTVTFTAVSACYLYAVQKTVGGLLAMIGALFLLFSDTCLSFVYFKEWRANRTLSVLELATYFAGQALIALSIMYV